jgi:2'-5' RNA ligase
MNAANVRIGMTARPSTGELIESARLIKSLMTRGDDIAMTLSEMFGPTGASDIEAMDEIRHVKGWQWTAILAKSLQFVMADMSVFLRKDLAQQIREYDPSITRSADQVTLQSQDIPQNYERAPDEFIITKLLQQPNPWTSQEHFKFDAGLQFNTHGVCHILVIPDRNGYPAQMWVIPKALITTQPPSRQNPSGSYRVGRLTRYSTMADPRMRDDDYQPQTLTEAYNWLSDREYPSEYVLKIDIPSLMWRDTNSSPTRAMSRTLMIDDSIQESRAATMKSQQSRGPKLKEREGISLSPDQKEEYLARYERENHGTTTEGAPRWASDLFDVENPMDTAREMEYTEGSIESRDSILGQNMVPPSIVGLGDSAGFAAVIGSAKQWATFCGQPLMDLMAGQLTTGLRTFFERPNNEFLIKLQAGRIDDDQVEETKLMNDLAAGTRTKGEWRDARKMPRFGDDRDNEIVGQGTLGTQLDGIGAAAYGDDLEGDIATPGIGAAIHDDPAIQPKGEMSDLSRLQFSRNRKSIEEQIERFSNGELKRSVALQFLMMLGVGEERANSLLDAVAPEETLKTDPVEEEVMSIIEPPSVTKSFGAPVPSGLPYILTYLPSDLQNTVEEWKLFINGGEYVDPGRPHVTLYGPVLDSGTEAVARITKIFEKQDLPAEVVMGKLKVFRNPGQHVLVIECLSHGLAALYKDLSAAIRSPLASHSMNLHITVAYGEPGAFDRYDGAELSGIAGNRYLVTEATLGTRESTIGTFRIGKPEVLSPGPSGITIGVPLVKSATEVPTVEKSLGMSTTSGESGGFVVTPATVEEPVIEKTTTEEIVPVVEQTKGPAVEQDDDDDDPWIEKTNDFMESLEA